MELNYITEFVKIIELGGFQKAAEELNISQSSLSQHIKRLEEQLGFQLLDRSSRNARITAAGQHFLEYAYRFVCLSNECEQEMSVYRGQEKFSLRLGTTILNRYNLTEFISKYSFQHPNINVIIQEASTAELKNMLLKNECDVIVIRSLEAVGEQFHSVLLQRDDSVLAVPANHRMAQTAGPILLKDFQRDAFIVPGDPHILNRLCKKACRNAGFTPRMIDTARNTHTVLAMVECGMGVAIVTKEMINRSFKNIVYLEYQDSVPLSIYALYRKNRRLSSACRMFIECLAAPQC